jgi:hypothetical protein
MRVAAGAATAGVAYRAGARRAEQEAYDAQLQAAQAPPPAPAAYAPPPYAPAPAPAASPMADLERLVELHDNGSLTDAEFAAAKASVLGQ